MTKAKKKIEQKEVMITHAFHMDGEIIPAGKKFKGDADFCAYLISEGKACAVDDEAGCKAAKENAERAKIIGQPVIRGGAISEAEMDAKIAAGVANALKAMGVTAGQSASA